MSLNGAASDLNFRIDSAHPADPLALIGESPSGRPAAC
jgi:hypothetical protein